MLRSLTGNPAEPISLNFVNALSAPINGYWLDYAGLREIWFSVPAGGSLSQVTFATHPWLVADTSGQCKAIYVTLPFSGQVVVQ
jgi:hypothetical protein